MAKKRVLKWVNLCLSLVVGGGLIYGLSNSIGPIPALAPTFNPGTGVWTTAGDEVLPHTEDLKLAGLEQKVQVIFEKDGTAHVKASTDHDAWMAVGYLHAKYRLLQMDLERRQGEGLLSEVVGASALPSDQFERAMALDRTAEAVWNSLPPNDELRQTLEVYTAGINAVIDDETKNDTLPMMFKMLGYKPTKWKPQDTLAIQGVLTQMLSLGSGQLSYQILTDSLGYDKTMQMLPLVPTNHEVPYDTGPYKQEPLKSISISAEAALEAQAKTAGTTSSQQTAATLQTTPSTSPASATLKSASQALQSTVAADSMGLMDLLDHLPTSALHQFLNSNSWVVDGTKTVSGKPMLAGDPHLQMTLPSTWYQMQVDSPSYHFSGVAVPGVPTILIGRNQDMTWSMTNGSNQQTFYYVEKMDDAHPNQYFYKGQWHNVNIVHEEIPVKGGKTVPYDIKNTIHGPLLSNSKVFNTYGKTVSVDWVGGIPSMSLRAMLNVSKVKSFDEFKSALSEWTAPTMNFVYSDKNGNIGIFGAGLYPQLSKDSKPWLLLRGTGEDDLIGTIPYDAIPQSYNPPTHMIATGNQREVTADYPYYVGPANMFEPSYRAGRVWDMLSAKPKLTEKDFEAIQNDTHDILASRIVPVLVQNLQGANLNDQEKQALSQLSTWDFNTTTDQVAPTLWYKFLEMYEQDTIFPWLQASKTPEAYKKKIIPMNMGLDQTMETWTLKDPDNDFFNNPVTKENRDAKTVMVQAFHDTIKALTTKLGTRDVSAWQWGKVHSRQITSLTQLPALTYGPKPANGDTFTVDVASDWSSDQGPSWRMITDWGTGQTVDIYPGGQSEDPLSPWYLDRMNAWWYGSYSPMLTYDQADANQDNVRWTFTP